MKHNILLAPCIFLGVFAVPKHGDVSSAVCKDQPSSPSFNTQKCANWSCRQDRQPHNNHKFKVFHNRCPKSAKDVVKVDFFFRHKVWFFNVRDRKNVLPWNHVIFWIINPQTEVSNDWAMIFNSLSSVNSLHIYLNNGNKMRCPKWKYFLHQLFPTSFAHKNKRCKDQWWSLVLHW